MSLKSGKIYIRIYFQNEEEVVMIKKLRIMTPGPTPVPVDVLLEGARETLYHRNPEFLKMLENVSSDLKLVFRTNDRVFILASSGTGAMEAAVANTVNAGDKVIAVVGGKFGERWADLCKVYNANMIELDVEWGDYLKPEQIKKLLDQNPDVKVVFTTLSETSTGVVNDIKSIAEIVRKTNALLVVDAVSGILAEPLETDMWGVDMVVAGSQKAFMMPPGLSFVAVSGEKAWKRIEEVKSPRYYFDLRAYKKSYTDTPYTGAVNLVYQLSKGLDMIKAEGVENVWTRHAIFGNAVRKGVKALGLELLAKRPGNVVTAVKVPEGIDGSKFLKFCREEYGMVFSEGQSQLKGKIFRVSNLGYVDKLDIISAIATIEMAMNKFGKKVPMGEGVKAAEEVLLGDERS
jgi:aspartate aminotransferase-like enzyme